MFKNATESSDEDPTFELGQIKINDANFAWYNSDYIATIDPYGSQDKYYTWDPETLAWYSCDSDCIIDFESPADNVNLPLNQAVIIRSENGVDLTSSGAVISGDTKLYGVAGDNTYTGNFTPDSITLGDIVVGDENFAWYNSDYIATIDPYGSQDKYYTWDPETLAWYSCDSDCIIDFDSSANKVEIEANMGLLFRTENGASLNIPSPIL